MKKKNFAQMDQSENLSDSIAHSSLARIMAVHNLTPINPGFKAQRNPFECQKKAVHSKRLLLEYFPDLCGGFNILHLIVILLICLFVCSN